MNTMRHQFRSDRVIEGFALEIYIIQLRTYPQGMDDENDDFSSAPLKKKKIVKLIGTCVVCGDKASSMNHYGSKVCFG